MRTTLSLDDDVLLAVKERAKRERRTAGEVLSDLARAALSGNDRLPGSVNIRNGFEVLPSRGGTVSNSLIDKLRDEEPE